MIINEAQRFEMHAELRKVLGDGVAGTLMDHLPPGGWADVARTRDVNQLHDRVADRFRNFEEQLDHRFERVDERLDSLVKGLWTIGTIVAGAFIGLFGLIVSTR